LLTSNHHLLQKIVFLPSFLQKMKLLFILVKHIQHLVNMLRCTQRKLLFYSPHYAETHKAVSLNCTMHKVIGLCLSWDILWFIQVYARTL